jgi:hypothetical protein
MSIHKIKYLVVHIDYIKNENLLEKYTNFSLTISTKFQIFLAINFFKLNLTLKNNICVEVFMK